MIARGQGGAIMNMCSICGTSATGRGSFPYSIAKGGIAMMTKELAIEWAKHGIRVNAIQPCQFLTPGLRHRLDNPQLGHIRDKFLSGIPLNRLGEPPRWSGPVIFLVSDAAAMVTGVLLPVDGGNLAMNAGGTKDSGNSETPAHRSAAPATRRRSAMKVSDSWWHALCRAPRRRRSCSTAAPR